MDRVSQLIAARQQEGYELWVAGGAPDEQVATLERALGVSLPPSYVTFLTVYGAIGVDDNFVSGIVTPRWSARVIDKVPITNTSARGAQFKR
jgi:hypothetical protein